MTEQTLEELKQEMEEQEEVTTKQPGDEQAEQSEETQDQEADAVEESEESEHPADDGEHESSGPDVEPWMLPGDDEGKTSESVPLVSHIKQKQKLKGRISDQKDEIAELKAEINALKTGTIQTQPHGKVPGSEIKRPSRLDYDTDEDFNAEYDRYLDKAEQERQQRLTAQNQRNAAMKQAQDAVRKAVEDHEARSIELSEKHGIKVENLEAANRNFRLAVDSVFPGKGDDFADLLISKIGDGSEKVLYHLGVNESARGQFISALANDHNGLQAMVFLGQKKAELTKPNRKTISGAPKPAAQHRGGGKPQSANAAKLKKAHDQALKNGNLQECFNLRRQATGAKIDISEW